MHEVMYGRDDYCGATWWVAWTDAGLCATARGGVAESTFLRRLARAGTRGLRSENAPPRSIDPEALPSGFAGAALAACARIPAGEVRTYGEVAAAAGSRGAARAVGTAMATNPLPGVIPCHRVVRADGTIGGYGEGGSRRKRELLAREGVTSTTAGVLHHV